ncbi:MAG: sulfatase [Planctomycetota bacterium]
MLIPALLLLVGVARAADGPNSGGPPNVVIVFADDLGYGDFGCFGSKTNPTPHIDRLAEEGAMLTDFLVGQAVCSASRAALLTGRYPSRVGVYGAFGPGSEGMAAEEVTLAELLKTAGYATGCFGKWHLGDVDGHWPTDQGFDEYYGLPYSNDMWTADPRFPLWPKGRRNWYSRFPDLPLVAGTAEDGISVVNADVQAADQAELTASYTSRAVDFIERHADGPFFCYVPHSMPHVPIYASERFAGSTGNGVYADVIAEIDWSVGEIVATLDRLGLSDNTWVVVTSDNGPWLEFGNHAGSSGPLREGKQTSFDGGCRVPCVMRWPGVIPAGVTIDTLTSTMDLLPTVAAAAGIALPGDRVIDGHDITPVLGGETDVTPWDAFYCYWGLNLQAIRTEDWKLHRPHRFKTIIEPGIDGIPGKTRQIDLGLSLFDMRNGVGERVDVAADHPDVVARLQAHADEAIALFGDETKRPR